MSDTVAPTETVGMESESGASSPVVRLHAVVRGRVQGVGYRYWMHHSVERFHGKVTGRVCNLPGGNVEVELESADRGLLEALLLEMHEGPHTGHVDAVDAIWEKDVEPRHSGPFRVA